MGKGAWERVGAFLESFLKPEKISKERHWWLNTPLVSISGSILFAKSRMKIFLATPVSPKGDFKREEKEWCLLFIA